MKYDRPVSTSVIRRLPRYYRFLGELLEKGINRISSKELSTLMKITASQIRQDLNCFGGFGQQGYGYQVESLHREIGEILGLNKEIPAILVGVGNLGRAVAPVWPLSSIPKSADFAWWGPLTRTGSWWERPCAKAA